jgi:dTDP-4-amino-4,6-dideoxygalactose transaminase
MNTIPFNIAYTSSKSSDHVAKLVENPLLLNEKFYTKACRQYFEDLYPGYKALMTPSCTKALEIISLALDFKPGDEIIMPSFNFVGVANAFVLHGGVPVFVDIDADTMNITPEIILQAITPKTKVVLVMHYAGVACEMDAIPNTSGFIRL